MLPAEYASDIANRRPEKIQLAAFCRQNSVGTVESAGPMAFVEKAKNVRSIPIAPCFLVHYHPLAQGRELLTDRVFLRSAATGMPEAAVACRISTDG